MVVGGLGEDKNAENEDCFRGVGEVRLEVLIRLQAAALFIDQMLIEVKRSHAH